MKIIAYKKLIYDLMRIELYDKSLLASVDVEYKKKKIRHTAEEYHINIGLNYAKKLYQVLGEYIHAKENCQE